MLETDSYNRSEDRVLRQKRRLLRVAAFVAVALALYALAGFVLAPPLIQWVIQKEGRAALHREVTLGKVTFNPFTLETDFLALRIRDRDRQPLLSLRRLHARLGISGIVRRAWRLRDLTIDGPVVAVRVLPNGSLSIADLFQSGGKSGPPPRLIIDHLAIRSGRVDFLDESVAPRFATSLTPVNVEVNDFITIPDEQGEHALQIGFNRESTIRISGKQVLEPLGISGRLEAKNVGLTTFTDRLTAGAPVVVRGGHVDIAIPYDLRRRSNGGIQFDVRNAEVTASCASRTTASPLPPSPISPG